jgi:hypothetical protein
VKIDQNVKNIEDKEGLILGKKHRNRINGQKKNNHIPPEAIEAEENAHGKEETSAKRKNGPGHNL